MFVSYVYCIIVRMQCLSYRIDIVSSNNALLTIISQLPFEPRIWRYILRIAYITEATLLNLPNVGGCEYAYVHLLNQFISKNKSPSDDDADSSLILFMKDTQRSMESMVGNKASFPLHSRQRTVMEMIEIASRGQFICEPSFCVTYPRFMILVSLICFE